MMSEALQYDFSNSHVFVIFDLRYENTSPAFDLDLINYFNNCLYGRAAFSSKTSGKY